MKARRLDLNIEYFLGQAKKRMEMFDWLGAVNNYKQGLNVLKKENSFMKGVLLEKIGYCYYRAAFQSQNKEDFKTRMRQSIASYDEATQLFEKTEDKRKQARIEVSKAKTAYNKSWLAEDPTERIALLDKCAKLAKSAIAIYQKAGENIKQGIVYCDLITCLYDRRWFAQDWRENRDILEEAIKYGKKAIKYLSEAGKSSELAQTHCILSWHFYDASAIGIYESIKKHRDLGQKAISYARKALDISTKAKDAYIIGMSSWTLGLMISAVDDDYESALPYISRAVESGTTTRDNLLLARAHGELADIIWYNTGAEKDPEKRRKQYKKAERVANDSVARYELVSYPFTWTYYHHLSSLTHLSMEEPDFKKKQFLLKRMVKVAERHLKKVRDAGSPEMVATILHPLSGALHDLSNMETEKNEKKRLLEKAAAYREECIRSIERLFGPFSNWARGMLYSRSAGIKADLAKMETDSNKRKGLLTEAVVTLEDSLKLLKEGLRRFPKTAARYSQFGRVQDICGAILSQLYFLTSEEMYLRKAVKNYEDAVKTWMKADLPSRKAESHWQMAKIYDDLHDYLNAAQEFESASQEYYRSVEKVPQLENFYLEYSSYMLAWAEVEKSRHFHEIGDYAHSKQHYEKCSQYLKATRKWAYLTSYFLAWSLLEHAENLSRQGKSQKTIAREIFKEAFSRFNRSVEALQEKVEELESSEEKDEALKLITNAKLQRQFCLGRILMEEADALNKRGQRQSSARKYASAQRIFNEIIPTLKKDKARRELNFTIYLCQAMEKMIQAEERISATLYEEAANLFAQAKETSFRKETSLTAMANSCFCKAQAFMIKFKTTAKTNFYRKAKVQLENATDYYRKARLEKTAFWVEAEKRLLDAHANIRRAEAEVDLRKRARIYQIAEECLRLSANYYGNSGHHEKQSEILSRLSKMKTERLIALSLSESLKASPTIPKATGTLMSDSAEKAAGLNGFESVNIQARLSVPENFVPGQEIQIRLDLINVGKKYGLIIRVEAINPLNAESAVEPPCFHLENDSLNMSGKRIEPLAVESVCIRSQVKDTTIISLKPRVVYADHIGNFRTQQIEEARIYPMINFKNETNKKIFNFLANEFTRDLKKRMPKEECGWRSRPQIIKNAEVSKASLYGPSGSFGPALSSLERKGLIDLIVLDKQRGRGGHILKIRICYTKEIVKRYL